MKPTSLSPEFYKKLYNEICEHEFTPESTEDDSCYIEIEDFEGYYICLKATFDVEVIDDSFDHAFGTWEGYHLEVGELTGIEEVTLCTEDDDVSDLFDIEAFFEQFKEYEVVRGGSVIAKSGDTVIAKSDRYRFEEVEFLYKDTQSGEYICKPIGTQRYKYPRSYKMVFPNTEANRKLIANR